MAQRCGPSARPSPNRRNDPASGPLLPTCTGISAAPPRPQQPRPQSQRFRATDRSAGLPVQQHRQAPLRAAAIRADAGGGRILEAMALSSRHRQAVYTHSSACPCLFPSPPAWPNPPINRIARQHFTSTFGCVAEVVAEGCGSVKKLDNAKLLILLGALGQTRTGTPCGGGF